MERLNDIIMRPGQHRQETSEQRSSQQDTPTQHPQGQRPRPRV